MAHAPTRFKRPGSAQLLSRILDQPDLVSSVRELSPPAFGKLVNHIGLADAGELVALATTEQLQQLLDDDLWRSEQPGRDATFDAERFTMWLEVMLEVGEAFTARKLTELPEDLVVLALNRHILVIDMDALAVQMADRHDRESVQLEKALSSAHSQEFEGYQVIARREEGWDAIVGVLCALDQNHHDFLNRVFERCAYAASELLDENGGLYNVLTATEMLESDAAAEREDRRVEEGYVAPSAAASFLGLARTTKLVDIENATTADPLTRAYFRNYQPDPKAAPQNPPSDRATHQNSATDAPSGIDKLLHILKDAEVLDNTRPTLLLADGGAFADEKIFKQALIELGQRDPRLHGRRMQELSYLANVLIAGCSFAGKSFRPLEAAEAVLAVCNLGCEHLMKASRSADAGVVVAQASADKLFRIGWHLLYRDVVQAAAHACARLFTQKARAITVHEAKAALGRLERDLQRAVAQGKPWMVRGKLSTLDVLIEKDARIALQDLIDECPRLHAAIDKSAPNSVPAIGSAAQFIATARQLRRVSSFFAGL